MKRRDFIKLSLVAGYSLLSTQTALAKDIDYTNVKFSKAKYDANNAQAIIVYLYGGASQLAGNLTNLEEIQAKSQSDYSYFRSITKTANDCWQEAGGEYMEEMLESGDLTIFRTAYSKVREKENNKAHGVCTAENQRGSFDLNRAGIVTNIGKILDQNGVINKDTLMPFISFEGDSGFYAQGDKPISSYLQAVGLDENLNNPYSRYVRYWYYYTQEERSSSKTYNANDASGFDPAFNATMDTMAQSINTDPNIKDAFSKRATLSSFIENISKTPTPDLGKDAYPIQDDFAKKMQSAIKVLAHNQDTKVITLNTGGLGGWDDHDDARNYVTRSELLFKTLKSAMAHLKALNKAGDVSIFVFGEFGRNVNLNSANGWDHGNLQNFYLLGGKNYFSHRGIVGETQLAKTGAINRLYLQPKEGSYSFEHISIAATLYKIFGVENPEVLTDSNKAVEI